MGRRRIDERGYPRGKVKHSDLIHRQVAHDEIYLKNRDKYPLPFGKYVVHHIDGDKKNYVVSNLQILTREEHEAIHGYRDGETIDTSTDGRVSSLKTIGLLIKAFLVFLILIVVPILIFSFWFSFMMN